MATCRSPRVPLQWFAHLVLPWICLSVVSMGFYSRVVRSSLLEVQSADYVRTARAMGLSRRRVLLRHMLRTALIPIASLFALDFGAAVGGTVILIEPVFGINGVGAYAQQAVAQLDLPPLMALTLYGGFFIVIVNAIADVAPHAASTRGSPLTDVAAHRAPLAACDRAAVHRPQRARSAGRPSAPRTSTCARCAGVDLRPRRRRDPRPRRRVGLAASRPSRWR